MGSSTSKKVMISRFDRETLLGFVSPQTHLTPHGIELLSLDGSVLVVPYLEVKVVYFVKDFEGNQPFAPKREFTARPKTEGLWLRFNFRDGDHLEGLLPNNLLQIETEGFTVSPPGASFQNQRIFIPRAALNEVQVLGVVGSPLRQKTKKLPTKDQLEMFDG